MKIKPLSVASAILLSSSSSLFAVTTFTAGVTSLNGVDIPTSTAFLDNGVAISNGGGSIAIGYFNTATPGSLSDTDLISSFVQFGSAGSLSNANGVDGFFDFSASSTIDATDSATNHFINETFAVLIGDQSTLATSTKFAALELTGLIFSDNNNPASGEQGVLLDSNSTLFIGADTGDFNFTAFSTNFTSDSITLAAVAVPEPSSTALLGLGAVGFLLRRRR